DHGNAKRQTVGHRIGHRIAWGTYLFFLMAPIPMVYYLASEIDQRQYLIYYAVVSGLLFGYNRWFQRLPLIGNAVVAGLCAFVISLPFLVETTSLVQLLEVDAVAFAMVRRITIGFVLFSFLANLIREIIKDIEDEAGDRLEGYRTLPIAIGVGNTKLVLYGTITLLFVTVVIWILSFALPPVPMTSLIIALVVPLGWITWLLRQASARSDFMRLSEMVKYYFGIGIIAMWVITFLLQT
ncbi:MAG: UbiA family prenyltransferase, partial [Bacteroidota bacterium]